MFRYVIYQELKCIMLDAIRGSYSTWNGYWTDACKKAGVEDAHFHDIRARVATTRDREGGSAKDLLGHSYQQTTDIYLVHSKSRRLNLFVAKSPSFREMKRPDAN